MRDLEDMGPVDYLVVEFPDGRVTGEGLPLLVDLVERGIIRILDLVFVRKLGDGTVEGLELTDVDHDGKLDLLMFEGVTTGLVDAEDLADTADVLNQGSVAAILVYENRWAAPLATTLRRGGGQLVAGGRIPVQALLAAVERVDTEVSR
ncbi:hypothetical protein GCM10009827_080880 [Dactylosporangium maewongense]|uniref:DUF1269 domain-containing protein n=1 Tax=Dactylosporangium maewongense TaxID=634393 RepID=A0ABP4MR29_9ACTN